MCGGDWYSCEGNEQGWTTSDLWVTLKNRLLETKLACSSGTCFRQIKKGSTSITVCQSVYLAALMATSETNLETKRHSGGALIKYCYYVDAEFVVAYILRLCRFSHLYFLPTSICVGVLEQPVLEQPTEVVCGISRARIYHSNSPSNSSPCKQPLAHSCALTHAYTRNLISTQSPITFASSHSFSQSSDKSKREPRNRI